MADLEKLLSCEEFGERPVSAATVCPGNQPANDYSEKKRRRPIERVEAPLVLPRSVRAVK